MKSFEILKDQVTVNGSIVTIDNPLLPTALVQEHANMLHDLSTMGEGKHIHVKDISIDEAGRVIVNNPKFAAAVANTVAAAAAGSSVGNGNCNCIQN